MAKLVTSALATIPRARLDRRADLSEVVGRFLADCAEALGPGYIKVAQFFATRATHQHQGMRRLHNEVRAEPWRNVEEVLRHQYGDDLAKTFRHIDQVPVGAGGVAQVHRALLTDGTPVALKILRADAARSLHRDLVTMRRVMRMLGVVSGELRYSSILAAVDVVSSVVLRQVDFVQEAESLRRLNVGARDPRIRIPEPVAELCGPNVIAMTFCDGPTLNEVPPSQRGFFAVRVLDALYTMVFETGFVHCDLHPGNIICQDDGTVCLVDAGVATQLPDSTRRAFAEFFWAIYQNDGDSCAAILRRTAETIGPDHDASSFDAAIRRHVDDFSDTAASGFDVVEFVRGLFRIQAEHGLVGGVDFVGAVVALATLAGVVATACPELRFQRLAEPHLAPLALAAYARRQ